MSIVARIVVFSLVSVMSVSCWAALAKLVRQETRRTPSGGSLLVCIYDAAGHELERSYPLGNFCPGYADFDDAGK